jgi:hypothetical protein
MRPESIQFILDQAGLASKVASAEREGSGCDLSPAEVRTLVEMWRLLASGAKAEERG